MINHRLSDFKTLGILLMSSLLQWFCKSFQYVQTCRNRVCSQAATYIETPHEYRSSTKCQTKKVIGKVLMNRLFSTERPLFFYGWVVVAVSFVTLGTVFGVWYSYSVFFLVIREDFGWSRAAASSIFSVFLFCHALMGLLAGYLQDRFGPRVVIPAGALLLAVSLLMTSQAEKLWHFFLNYGFLAGTGVSLIGFTSHAAFLPKWFERKRGLAVGMAMAGIGFGVLILVPLLERHIASYGWRSAYQLAAILVLILIAPLNLVFSRKSPKDLNLLPDGDSPETPDTRQTASRTIEVIDTEWADQDWTFQKALRTNRFWLLAGAFFCIAFAYQSTLLHSVAAMVDIGLDRSTAAYYFGILGVSGSAGKILFGYLSDLSGRERASTIGVVFSSLGILCLIKADLAIAFLPLVFAFLFGMGYGSAAPLLPSIGADIFMGRAFGLIFAMVVIGGGVGGALGAYMSGWLHDMSGSYTVAFFVSITSLSLGCLLIWFAAPRKIRRNVKRSSLTAE